MKAFWINFLMQMAETALEEFAKTGDGSIAPAATATAAQIKIFRAQLTPHIEAGR